MNRAYCATLKSVVKNKANLSLMFSTSPSRFSPFVLVRWVKQCQSLRRCCNSWPAHDLRWPQSSGYYEDSSPLFGLSVYRELVHCWTLRSCWPCAAAFEPVGLSSTELIAMGEGLESAPPWNEDTAPVKALPILDMTTALASWTTARMPVKRERSIGVRSKAARYFVIHSCSTSDIVRSVGIGRASGFADPVQL